MVYDNLAEILVDDKSHSDSEKHIPENREEETFRRTSITSDRKAMNDIQLWF